MKKRLKKLFRRRVSVVPPPPLPPWYSGDHLPSDLMCNADVIITSNEINDRHGTGVILNRVFKGEKNLLSIRASNFYKEQTLNSAHVCISQTGLTRAQSFAKTFFSLNGTTVKRVLCVPYLADDLVTAVALKEMFGARICTFVMDDNNIYSRGIPDDSMRELLAKSDLRLAISPQMRDEYEKKFKSRFWIVPPLVGSHIINRQAHFPTAEILRSGTGILVGNIWSSQWLQMLVALMKQTGLKLHWFGNAAASWLKTSKEELNAAGIVDCGFIPETELAQKMKEYPFAVIPSGTLDDRDDRPGMALLSLPSRMPYLLSSMNMPMLVLGSPKTCAAQFVLRLKLGLVIDYDPAQYKSAIQEICQDHRQREFRESAVRNCPAFSAEGMATWIWDSLEQGRAMNDRFEKLFLPENSI